MSLHHFPGRLDAVETRIRMASICPSNWTGVLGSLEGLFPGATATLQRVMPATDEARIPQAGELRTMAAHGLSGTGLRPPAHPAVGTVFPLRDPASPAACAGSPASFGGGILLHHAGKWIWMLTVRAPEAAGATYDHAIMALLYRLRAELRRSFLVSRHIGMMQPPCRAEIEAAWDPLPLGVALMTPELRPLLANSAAEDVFSIRSLFAPLGAKGRLRPVSREASELFEHAAARITDGESERESLEIGNSRSRQHLAVDLFDVARTRNAAFFRDPGSRRPNRLVATFTLLADSPAVAGPAQVEKEHIRFG